MMAGGSRLVIPLIQDSLLVYLHTLEVRLQQLLQPLAGLGRTLIQHEKEERIQLSKAIPKQVLPGESVYVR